MKENISKGERVRKFTVEGKTRKGWQKIVEGTCIGHKYIGKFENIEVSALRLKISESLDTPKILGFSVFNIQD